jgi:nucleoside-diphosphate-sugar epimerase
MLTHLNASPAAPARVVILGARGFIARALAGKLATDRIPVLAISSQELDLTLPGAGSVLGALLQPADAVVMTAALTPDKGRDVPTLMKNLRMAESVAAALAAKPCAHFVYLSSDAVYDWRHPLISEAIAPSPTDLYSTMHLAREQILAAATAATKVPYCILRPCAVYGPGDTHNGYGPNRFVRSAVTEGKIKLFGGGEETRDHVFIEDVTAILGLTLCHRSTGTLNVVSGHSATFAEVASLIAGLCPRPVVIESLPRSGPVTHRHFDPIGLLRAFPGHTMANLSAGMLRILSGPAQPK